MIFSCTSKVIKKLKGLRTVENDQAEISWENWYLNLIKLERKDYLLFTHSSTLFTLFFAAGTRKELNKLEERFKLNVIQRISNVVNSENQEKNLEHLFPNDSNYRLIKTNSRSILGSMNDFYFQIKVLIEYEGPLSESISLIHQRINETPMSGIDYKSPRKLLLENLELTFR